MLLTEGILATANRLGMSPEDLATIISYETAGTFDPMKRGPTTKWGQHRGLIQFGEPQAREFGVNWEDPITSQLGEGGAVERYFRAHGWQPGMSMLDAYSIVNAGGPGRYNASDTAAGGAPGTVRDKVEGQMAEHREKARALLAGNAPPQSASAPPAQAAARAATPPPEPPKSQPAGSPVARSVASLLGAEPSRVTALLAALSEESNKTARPAADPRDSFAANIAWARKLGWRI